MRNILFAILIVVFFLSIPVSRAQQAMPDLSEAYQWLELLDNKKYFQSWQYAGRYFKNNIEAAEWNAILTSTRENLGRLTKRQLVAYGEKKQFANLPTGDYLVLKFSSQFANESNYDEILVLSEEYGKHKVVAYFIQ